MGFGEVREKIEWESKRIEVAFGVRVRHTLPRDEFLEFIATDGTSTLTWGFNTETGELAWMTEGVGFIGCQVHFNSGAPSIEVREGGNAEFLARGLYRLGIEDEAVLVSLPSLSTHEKMELRLSMSREFWPQVWLGEDGT